MSEDEGEQEMSGSVDENEFDLIILGTSLIESIVACAAARNGKRVLHVDHRDHYGGSYAAFNVSGLLKQHKLSEGAQLSSQTSDFTAKPITELVIGGKDPSPSVGAFLSYNYSTKKFFHPSMQGIISGDISPLDHCDKDSSKVHPAFFGLLTTEQQQSAHLLTKDREFCIDTATKTIPGTGVFIDALIASGVSRYLEFKTSDAMFYLISDEHSSSSSLFSGSNQGVSPILWRVPCSKNDIFNSKQLSALEKRALMKFHQFVSDWGRTNAGADVTVLNENELAIGRSLYRPQNKAADAATGATAASALTTEALQTQSFAAFLKSYHLSEKLQNLITYGLCLLPASSETPVATAQPLSAHRGLQELSLHLNSLGKYGEHANLVPIYGLGEVVQGFCRMSAVWASTYMLRYELSSLTIEEHEVKAEEVEVTTTATDATSATTDEGAEAAAPVAVPPSVTTTVLKRAVHIQGISEVERYDGDTSSPPVYKAPRALVNYSYAPTKTHCVPLFGLQAIFVYQGRLLPSDRCLTVIPPKYAYKGNHDGTPSLIHLQNPFAVHVLQADSSASTVPDGATILQVHTYFPAETSESFPFADWTTEATKVQHLANALIDRIQVLLESLAKPSTGSAICHRVLFRPVFDRAITTSRNPDTTILFCGDTGGYSLHLEDEVKEAERLYRALFGADTVLFNPEGPDPQEEMQLQDDDDDEVEHLYKYATASMTLTEPALAESSESAAATSAASALDTTNEPPSETDAAV